MRRAGCVWLVLVLLPAALWAAITFPPLTGRVVDDAQVLSTGSVQRLERLLGDYERGTSNQVVVATVSSLRGVTIEEYANALLRHWKLGQKDRDNGVLILVAPAERKVRIEAGYGMEGALTDAQSIAIIRSVMTPRFKSGEMEQGIEDGAQAVLDTLGGQGIPLSGEGVSVSALLALFFILWMFLRFSRRHPLLSALLLANESARFGSRSGYGGFGGGFGGGGFGGGGFRGGGGSSGGGGASGSW